MIEQLGNIVVIGLKAREDRWLRCKEIFETIGVKQVTHYSTVQNFADPHRNYMKDFTQMLRVRGRISNNLVFFEDDFELCEGWEDVLRKAWNDLPADFDMLYLGCNLTRPPLKITDNLYRVMGAWLMHATILSKKFVQYVIEKYDYNAIWIIDDWYRLMAPQKKFYMTYPFISYQRSDYSDMVGQYIFYDIFNNKFYKNL